MKFECKDKQELERCISGLLISDPKELQIKVKKVLKIDGWNYIVTVG